jgi:hypothetical protein
LNAPCSKEEAMQTLMRMTMSRLIDLLERYLNASPDDPAE